MKVFLAIVTMFATGFSDSAYAAGTPDHKSEKTGGIIAAITDFFDSLFGDTNNPVKGQASTDSNGKGKGKGVANPVNKDDNPVPEMEDDDSSADFIAARIAADTGWPIEEMMPYSRRLAKTLSQLSAEEQAEVFYGSD